MIGTPLGSCASDCEAEQQPRHAAAQALVLRSAVKPHPKTPARQVVLEAEEQVGRRPTFQQAACASGRPYPGQAAAPHRGAKGARPRRPPATTQDIIMDFSEADAVAGQAGALAAGAESLAPPAAARLPPRSQVVVPDTYDPRSIRQLKKEIKGRMAAREVPGAAGSPPAAAEGKPAYGRMAIDIQVRRWAPQRPGTWYLVLHTALPSRRSHASVRRRCRSTPLVAAPRRSWQTCLGR